MFLATAGSALGCSTGSPPSVDDIARTAKFIVVADVVSIGPAGLNDRLRIVQAIRGATSVGDTVTIGPRSVPSPPSSFPDCWLRLPPSTRVLVALSSTQDLDALMSWAWWEEDGAVVTASAVKPTHGSL